MWVEIYIYIYTFNIALSSVSCVTACLFPQVFPMLQLPQNLSSLLYYNCQLNKPESSFTLLCCVFQFRISLLSCFPYFTLKANYYWSYSSGKKANKQKYLRDVLQFVVCLFYKHLFFAVLRISLALFLIYCRCKFIVAKVIVLQMHSTSQKPFFSYVSINTHI